MTTKSTTFLLTAEQIGAKLCRDALWSGTLCNWLGDTKTVVGIEPVVTHRTLGTAAYAGTAGIALFLSKLFQHTGERLFRLTAYGAIRHAMTHHHRILPCYSHSYYSGALGIADIAIQIGMEFQDNALIEAGTSLLSNQLPISVATQELDLISGSASAIPTFLRLYQKLGQPALLQVAICHGDQLVNRAIKLDMGWAWETMNEPTVRPLCGLAHGASGIGLALLELYQVTNHNIYLNAAYEAFRYEEHWFDEAEANYPDFRLPFPVSANRQNNSSFMTAWCHGAPGIGIARTRAYELLPDPAFRHAAERAATTTSRQLHTLLDSPMLNYSLCHGAGGNAAFLLYAARVFQEPAYRQVAEDVGIAGIARSPEQHMPWMCGVAQGGETPNLMLGTAGIGYFYLSLAEERELPPLYI